MKNHIKILEKDKKKENESTKKLQSELKEKYDEIQANYSDIKLIFSVGVFLMFITLFAIWTR